MSGLNVEDILESMYAGRLARESGTSHKILSGEANESRETVEFTLDLSETVLRNIQEITMHTGGSARDTIIDFLALGYMVLRQMHHVGEEFEREMYTRRGREGLKKEDIN